MGLSGREIKALAWLCSVWGLWGRIHFLAFYSFQRLPHALAQVPTSPSSKPATLHPCPQYLVICPWSHLPLTDFSFLPPSFTFKDLCDYPGQPRYSKITFLQTHLISILIPSATLLPLHHAIQHNRSLQGQDRMSWG